MADGDTASKPVWPLFLVGFIVLAALASIFVLIPMGVGVTGNGSRTTTTTAVPSSLTLATYNRLQAGMTYEQVREILGSSGTEMSRLELAGITTVMYQWTRFGGANMNAMFQNGQLVSKAQFGLR